MAALSLREAPTHATDQQLTCREDLDPTRYVNTLSRPIQNWQLVIITSLSRVTFSHKGDRNLKNEVATRVCQRSEISQELHNHSSRLLDMLRSESPSIVTCLSFGNDGWASPERGVTTFQNVAAAHTIGIEMRRTTDLWSMYRHRISDDYRFHIPMRAVICVGLHCVLFKFAFRIFECDSFEYGQF